MVYKSQSHIIHWGSEINKFGTLAIASKHYELIIIHWGLNDARYRQGKHIRNEDIKTSVIDAWQHDGIILL